MISLKKFLKKNNFILDILCSNLYLEDKMNNTYSIKDIENRRSFDDRLKDLKQKLYTAFFETNIQKEGKERTAEEQKQYVMFYFALQIAWLLMTDKLWEEPTLNNEDEQIEIHADEDQCGENISEKQEGQECNTDNN